METATQRSIRLLFFVITVPHLPAGHVAANAAWLFAARRKVSVFPRTDEGG